MKDLIDRVVEIIIRPSAAVKRISEEEPLFSGLLVFTVAVIVSNLPLVRSFMVQWRAGVFNVIALVSIWGAALVVVNLIITGIQKLINPLTSSLMDGERFRKLTVVEFHIAVILVLRPLLVLLFSPVVVRVILSAWVIILAIAAVCHLWNVAEIKSALSVLLSAGLVFMGGRVLDPGNEYSSSRDFYQLKENIAESSLTPAYGILGFDRQQYIEKNRENVARAAENFIEKNPRSPVMPYAMLVRACALLGLDRIQEATEIYRSLVSEDIDSPAPVYKSAMAKLSRLLEDRQYNLLPTDITPANFRGVIQMWRLPLSLSYYRGNMHRIGAIKEMIEEDSAYNLKVKMEPVIRNFKYTDFMDDISYWLARRYEKEGKYEEALNAYKNTPVPHYLPSPERIDIETIMGYIASMMGSEDILVERYRHPQALLGKVRVYRKKGRIEEALEKIDFLVRRYPAHGSSAAALAIKAGINQEDGNFHSAAEIYGRIIDNYPLSDIVPEIEQKKRILTENLSNTGLLKAYLSGLQKWREGEKEKAIEIYTDIGRNFSHTRLARRLQYSIGGYYRSRGRYMEAISELRRGHKNFPDTGYGFQSALMVAEILRDDLNDYRNAAKWLREIIHYYPSDFESEISGYNTSHAAFLAAEIAKENLGDYNFALEIYDFIIENHSSPQTVSRALFEKAFLLEERYRSYSDAVSAYKRIISEFPQTSFKEDASLRLEKIYKQGDKNGDRTP